MPLTRADVGTLACPACGGSLRVRVDADRDAGTYGDRILDAGSLDCDRCTRRWPIEHGVPQLCDDAEVGGLDRLLRPIYDFIAPYHDLGVEIALRVLQFPDFGASRDRYIERLALGALRPHADGSPVRILEVGVGAGANMPLLARALPRGTAGELWGVDYSRGMLRQAAWRLRRTPVRLLLADAHALPFPDASFDRVFHVGGINGYRDIRRALTEMARVARPDTPIVVVDEELDPHRSNWLFHRLAFDAITFFDPNPHAPRELVPPGAYDVAVTPVSRFYYCLTFRVGAAATQRTPSPPPPPPTPDDGADAERTPPMPIDTILNAAQLAILRAQFDPAEMNAVMGAPLPAAYPACEPYLETIGDLFYGGVSGDTSGSPLSAKNRERCLVAILSTRGAGFNLALHMYMAIALDVSPKEVVHIALLAGTYTGIDNFAGATATAAKTFTVLATVATTGIARAANVFTALALAFPA